MAAQNSASLGFSRADIPNLTVQVLRPGDGARPDVRLLEVNGARIVIKDYAAGANMLKRGMGRYLVERELAAYKRLHGLKGIPPCLGCLDPYTLVVRHVDAEPAPIIDASRLTPDFFSRLLEMVCCIHERGVAHGDLKCLHNILVHKNDTPVLVDFTAAVISGSSPLAALVMPHIFEDDLRGVYKLKMRHAPDALTPEEEAFLEYRGFAEKLFRSVRDRLRKPFQRLSGAEL
jgi:RIO-like serine/threonine protein kinase